VPHIADVCPGKKHTQAESEERTTFKLIKKLTT
jgi:hypothetical protein